MQFDKHFTLAEADALLPWVREILDKVHRCLGLLQHPPAPLPGAAPAGAGGNGHGHAHGNGNGNGHNGHGKHNGAPKMAAGAGALPGGALLAEGLDLALRLPVNHLVQFDPQSAEERRLTEIWRQLNDEQRLELINALLGALTERGIVVQDVGRGLLDFPALAGGEEVLLCYELRDGEAIVAWHDLYAGFAGRRPLSELPQG